MKVSEMIKCLETYPDDYEIIILDREGQGYHPIVHTYNMLANQFGDIYKDKFVEVLLENHVDHTANDTVELDEEEEPVGKFIVSNTGSLYYGLRGDATRTGNLITIRFDERIPHRASYVEKANFTRDEVRPIQR